MAAHRLRISPIPAKPCRNEKVRPFHRDLTKCPGHAGHSVDDISRSDAGAVNLTRTSAVINRIIRDARVEGRKAICFVTGVPGAGKTLVDLLARTYQVG
jgi:hypothetical protein